MERRHNSENMFVRLISSASEFMNQFQLYLVSGCVLREFWWNFNFGLYQ